MVKTKKARVLLPKLAAGTPSTNVQARQASASQIDKKMLPE